jgi:hypothetical protein
MVLPRWRQECLVLWKEWSLNAPSVQRGVALMLLVGPEEGLPSSSTSRDQMALMESEKSLFKKYGYDTKLLLL